MNRTNQIFELNNKKKYFVLKQAIYKNKNYYLSVLVDNDNLTDKFILFEEIIKDRIYIKEVKDLKIKRIILKYLGIIS